MKKYLWIPICLALVMAAAPVLTARGVVAEEKEAPAAPLRVSPALDVLANELKLTKTGLVNREIAFSPLDFETLLGVGHLSSITVLTLPDESVGKLYLESTPVMKNQVISREMLSALKFRPAKDKSGDCTFVFGTVSSSQPLALSCTLRLSEGMNFAPEAESTGGKSLSTLAGIPLHGRLSATDPEGDALTYRILSYPEGGTLRLSDRAEGRYVYTPLSGYIGKDSFTYVVIDEYGNPSDEVKVSVEVEQPQTALVYCDLAGNPAQLPAMRLAEAGVMIGETIGASAYFHPERSVTRAEFLAMVMCAAGIEVPAEGEATTFADDAEIPDYLRRYVSYAKAKGYIVGSSADGNGSFEPCRAVTFAEAAVMLQSVLDLRATGVYSVFADGQEIPAWAEEAVFAVAGAGLFPEGVFAADSSLTRADAAVMLSGVLAR